MTNQFFGPLLVLAHEHACALDLIAEGTELHETWRASIGAFREVDATLAELGLPTPSIVTHLLQRAEEAQEPDN